MTELRTNGGFATMNSTAGALLRFWWLVVAGIAAGAFVAVFVYSLQSEAKHTATTRVLVNSASAPYLRTQQTQAQAPRVRTVRKARAGLARCSSRRRSRPRRPTPSAREGGEPLPVPDQVGRG